jgi:Divergent InlB B-repeat domain
MRRAVRALAGGLVVLGLLLAAPGGALGAANHPFLGVVGPADHEDACGLAFGPGGLYVSDYGANAIEGPTTITGEAPQGGPCKIAFDPAGDLYVNNWHRDVVRYEAGVLTTGAYEVIDPEPADAAEAPTGLAVDPVSGDLYVAHRTFISRYAAPVHAGEAPTTIGMNAGAAYYGIAYSNFPATLGRLYVPDAATHTVEVFDPATSTTTPVEEVTGEAGPQGGFHDLLDSEALVDNESSSPSYGHFYVLDRIGREPVTGTPEGVLDEFNGEGEYRGQIKGFTDAGPSGIAIEAVTDNVLLTSGGAEGSAVYKYGPAAPARKLTVAKVGTGGGAVRSQPAGIACGSACAAEYTEGEKVELFAAPDAHSVFKGWSGGGCTGAGSCTLLMSAATEVQTEFEEPTQETLTVSVSGAGAGTVKSEPAGLSCAGACSEHFNQGRLVTLTAAPAPGSRFAGWSGGGCSGVAACQVTMAEARSVAADFEPIPALPLTISVTGTGAGTVTSGPSGLSCPGVCAAGFGEGSVVTLIASAAPGSVFAGWSGGCAGTTPICAVTISAAQSVGAGFEPRPAGAPPGKVGSIPCESDECAPLPVAPEDPTVASLVPGASNPPVRFPPTRCPKGKKQTKRKGKVACVAMKHHQHKQKHGKDKNSHPKKKRK